jgi:small conductance mechanosensitive channel
MGGDMNLKFNLEKIWEQLQTQLLSNGLRALFMGIVILVLVRSTSFLTSLLLRRLSMVQGADADETNRRLETVAGVVTAIVKFSIMAVGGRRMLREIGFDVAPLIASAGILGVAIGFGSQQLVKDFITGFFILIENQYRVGDSVKIAGCEGVVEQITLRTTWIRDLSGAVYVIPNSKIEVVVNQTYDWARAVVEVGVSYGADLEKIAATLKAIVKSLKDEAAFKDVLMDEGTVNSVERLEADAVVLRVIVKTRAPRQWAVQRELRKRVVERLGQMAVEGFRRTPVIPLQAARSAYKQL